MSTPESLVPTRETCERLREAGFPQETFLAWLTPKARPPFVRPVDPVEIGVSESIRCAAPTLAELMAVLPAKIKHGGETYWLEMDRVYWDVETDTYCPRVFYADLDRKTLPLNEHERAIEWSGTAAEVAARLYLALHAASLLPASPAAPAPTQA